MKAKGLTIIIISSLILSIACSSNKMGLNNPIDAALIGNEYSLDIKKGDKNYKGKYITVVGQLSQSYQNKFQENILILMGNDKKHGVKCTLVKSNKPLERPFKLGETIKINGKCNGFDEFVLLSGCIILKD